MEAVQGCPTGRSHDQGVVEMVAQCFEWEAVALEKHGGQVLTDSVHHHCWSFPPPSLCPRAPSHSASPGKTCNCGAIALTSIPVDATWTALGGADSALATPLPPPSIMGMPRQLSQGFPEVFDLLVCRVSALSCAAELTQALLTTAWLLQTRQ